MLLRAGPSHTTHVSLTSHPRQLFENVPMLVLLGGGWRPMATSDIDSSEGAVAGRLPSG